MNSKVDRLKIRRSRPMAPTSERASDGRPKPVDRQGGDKDQASVTHARTSSRRMRRQRCIPEQADDEHESRCGNKACTHDDEDDECTEERREQERHPELFADTCEGLHAPPAEGGTSASIAAAIQSLRKIARRTSRSTRIINASRKATPARDRTTRQQRRPRCSENSRSGASGEAARRSPDNGLATRSRSIRHEAATPAAEPMRMSRQPAGPAGRPPASVSRTRGSVATGAGRTAQRKCRTPHSRTAMGV